MYLKRLELQGFKSFADKTILEFKPGITSVIGPNGSGKSNISDAIRWVLGEQSMKSLRGAKSEDIMFAGTQEGKSLGFAEVSIVIDNSDAKLPIEYAEVTVTRKIYRNGETGYFINKTPCRLKDILELFMDTGIGKDGYSIIGQGKIDEILSNKSEDRRHIFEEAAGIVKYRTRKQESEKKMEQTKLNLLRINDILTEIEGNIEPLKADISKWASNTYYYQGMIVEYQYNLYKCETAHKSSTLFVDEDKTTNTVYWKPLGKLNTQLEYYDSTKTYNINDCVLQKEDYGASKWVSGTTYKVDDTVVYNEIIYKCKTANSDTAFTDSNWEEINTEKTILYRCLKSTANAPSISSTEWEEIDCYIELASDKDIEDLFT